MTAPPLKRILIAACSAIVLVANGLSAAASPLLVYTFPTLVTVTAIALGRDRLSPRIAVAHAPRGERRQVTARTRFRKPLAPELVGT